MKKPVDHSLRLPLIGRLWLLASLLLVMLPHLLRMPVWLSIPPVILIVWRFQRDRRGWNLPPTWLRLLLTFFAIVAVQQTYHSLIGREAGVAFLTMMLAVKLLELRNQRDAMVVIFLGYFLVITGFLFSQSIFMGAYLFLVVLSLTGALIALNHPAASFARGKFYLRQAGSLLLQALPIMILLFVLFPRIPGPLWNLPKDKTSGLTGLSNELTFGDINSLATSDEVAFRVQFDNDIPDAAQLYWRGPVLWHTNGARWTPLTPQEQRRINPQRQALETTAEAVGYTVILEPHGQKWIFALDLPGKKPETTTETEMTADYQLQAKKSIEEMLRYHQTSYLRYNTGFLEEWAWSRALQLPENNNPQTHALAAQWREKITSDRAIVDMALNHFRNEAFFYTREPPLYLGENNVDEFLFDGRRGFCEHYAVAFTTLMRSAGIPARIVTGYQGGEFNPAGDYLIIRQANAHAWSEVWLEEEGWVRIDPTSEIPRERVEATPDLNRFTSTEPPPLTDQQIAWIAKAWRGMRNQWDALNHGWNQWVLGFDKKKQAELMQKLGLGNIDMQGKLLLLLGLIGASFALVTLWVLRPQSTQRDPIRELYDLYCAKLEKRGLGRKEHEGPVDYANRVKQARPELTEQVEHITRLYVQLRYGHAADTGLQQNLKEALRRFSP